MSWIFDLLDRSNRILMLKNINGICVCSFLEKTTETKTLPPEMERVNTTDHVQNTNINICLPTHVTWYCTHVLCHHHFCSNKKRNFCLLVCCRTKEVQFLCLPSHKNRNSATGKCFDLFLLITTPERMHGWWIFFLSPPN